MQTAWLEFLEGAIQLLTDRNPGHKIHYPRSWPLQCQHGQRGQGLSGRTPQTEEDASPSCNLVSH